MSYRVRSVRPIVKGKKSFSNLHRRRQTLRIVLAVIILVMSICAVLYVARAERFQIKNVEAQGTASSTTDHIRQYVVAELAGSYVALLPKDNMFLYPKSSIQKGILSSFPDLESASIERDGDTLKVSVKEFEKKYLFCKTTNDCVYLNRAGEPFARIDSTGTRDDLVIIGAPRMAPADAAKIIETVEAFGSVGIRIKSVTLADSTWATLQTSSGWSILYKWVDPVGDTIEKFKLAKSSSALTGKDFVALDYLDLRYGNKIYYKWK